MSPNAKTFRKELARILETAEGLGLSAVELRAGGLHRRVGGYPGADHRMPVCCSVMRDAMRTGDAVVAEPEKGAGASLTIRYSLQK